MNPAKRINNFIRYRLLPPHNMLTHPAERFYFEQYAEKILPYFGPDKTLLDIGCQHGRFTISAVKASMKVTATDIKPEYFRSIQKHIGNDSVQFRLEHLEVSLEQLPSSAFDVVLCIELLYNLPHTAENIQKLAKLLKPGGVLITSHRSKGYYIYRFLREKNFDALQKILSANHTDYNAQSASELNDIFTGAGLKVKNISPIGMFSGFGKDAFSGIANPVILTMHQKNELKILETNPQLQAMFGECARYWLVCAEHQ
jgi:2-polyprenyl-3-methyl-5-hydroxy-6-metoxy-1,4-benzoquinol methylase